MILLLDTTEVHCGRRLTDMLDAAGRTDYEYVDTTEKKISHCLGCNHCWLKTPGVCSIKDDYEPILKKMSAAGQVWLISDTKFGFVTYRAKNIIDRVMPLVTMNLHFQGKQMRHVLRYNHNPDFGIIFSGVGDREYLTKWCERLTVNFGTHSLGVYPLDQMKEAAACM